MPRLMSTAMAAAIASPYLSFALFCEANFTSGPVYIWSRGYPIVWNGQTWLGLGALASISTIAEGSDVEARGIALGLSGFDPTFLPAVMNEFALLLPVIVYLGLFDAGVLIADPIIAFSGRMDKPEIAASGKTASISIACESTLADMNVAVNRRKTADDQQRDHPGDLAYNYVMAIQERNEYWGVAPTTTNNL